MPSSTVSDQLTPFPSLLVSVLHNSRESLLPWALPSQDGGRNCLQTDLLCFFVLSCFGVRGRVQLCLPAAGCTRAADMTALTNKRTGKDAHRCMLRRTQTAQYEAIPLPVSPRSRAWDSRLTPPPTPTPPPAALPPPSHPNGSKTEWGSTRKLHLDRVFLQGAAFVISPYLEHNKLKEMTKIRCVKSHSRPNDPKNLVQTPVSAFFNRESLKTLNCRQTKGRRVGCCFTFFLIMKIT